MTGILHQNAPQVYAIQLGPIGHIGRLPDSNSPAFVALSPRSTFERLNW